MKVLLTGATGVAGLGILRVLLADNSVSHVTYLGRRPLPPWVILPNGTSTNNNSPTHPKLSTIEHKDFLNFPPALQEKIAGHEPASGHWAFQPALKEKGSGTAENPYRVVFVSGLGADSKETSRVLFERVKGRAENNLIRAAEESGGRIGATIMRPGYFFPSKDYPQDAPNQRGLALRVADKLFGAPLSLFYSGGVISVEQIGQFALAAARGKWEGKGKVIFENAEMKKFLQNLNESTRSREEL
ncbi:hypothetical protein B0F90DRAFT_1815485 [Multifurca ochricompacta]|uniref:NAD(P)-binding domain-containing protein n=1 Tax=Multifurca ochricompacta TaxID=376703 RepID=A0AAD4M841_9AGAM|nr:hypothetical protein B0F90DRAFT_1815485 [Multifurca ochricompacta]